MSKDYIGPFKEVVPLYIEYKRSLGYDAISEEGELKRLDKFFSNKGITEVKLTKEMIEEYCMRRKNENQDTQRHRLSLVKQFAVFLSKSGYKNIYVHNIKLKKEDSQFKPYIYSQDELKRIFEYIDAHQYDNKSIYDFILPIFIRFLYGCGLRKKELINLTENDIDYIQKTITINDSKCHVSRIVPLSDSLFDSYINYKKKHNIKSKYLICNSKGEKISHHITEYFQKILMKLNIKRPDGTPPRLHDFRFTFAVNALEKMEKNGQDLYTTLPILSKYLGHKNISSTEYYLMLVQDYFINITSKEEKYYSDLLKSEDIDNG